MWDYHWKQKKYVLDGLSQDKEEKHIWNTFALFCTELVKKRKIGKIIKKIELDIKSTTSSTNTNLSGAIILLKIVLLKKWIIFSCDFLLQQHLVMMSKFGLDTFSSFWLIGYIKAFAQQWWWKQQQQRKMFVKHVCPPKLKCHCDLDLWPRNPKFNRGHLLVMANQHTKLEDTGAISFLLLMGQALSTDWPTNQPTFAKLYTPTSSKGGIMMI